MRCITLPMLVFLSWLACCEPLVLRAQTPQSPEPASGDSTDGAGRRPKKNPSAEEQSKRTALANWQRLLAGGLYGEDLESEVARKAQRELWQQATQARLQKKYPIESLRQRLAYEERSALYTTAPAEKAAKPPGTPHNPLGLTSRAEALRQLHQGTAEEFINSQGFGRGRQPGPRGEQLVLLEPGDPLAADDSPARSSALGPDAPIKLSDTQFDLGAFAGRAPSKDLLYAFNSQSKAIFANESWFGYAESIDQVTGFVPHQFWMKPELSTGWRAWHEDSKHNAAQKQRYDCWRNTELQLVSLLKHPEPRVYLSKNLPAMTELEHAETRALDAFEQKALVKLRQPQLRGDGEVVVEASTNTIRMMGPLRTEGACSDCHQVKSGSLLGAFSYVFERDPPISAAKVAKKSR